MDPSGIKANASVVRPSRMSVGLPQLQGYGLAVLSIGIAVGTLLLFEQIGWRSIPVACLTVVGMNTWYGKRGPGLFSIILGSVCMDYFLLEPHYTLTLHAPISRMC